MVVEIVVKVAVEFVVVEVVVADISVPTPFTFGGEEI